MGLFDGTATPGPGGWHRQCRQRPRARWRFRCCWCSTSAARRRRRPRSRSAAPGSTPGSRWPPWCSTTWPAPRHAARARDAIVAAGLPVLGALPRDAAIRLPERHLGLVGASEHAGLPAHFATLASPGRGALATFRRSWPRPGHSRRRTRCRPCCLPAARAAHRDRARRWPSPFSTPHVLAGWRASPVPRLSFFSPLADEGAGRRGPTPSGCPAATRNCTRPGSPASRRGSSPACATAVARGRRDPRRVRRLHGARTRALTDAAGTTHAMAGACSMWPPTSPRRRLHLGYRRARLTTASALGPAGTTIAGHEHHHTVVAARAGTDAPLATLEDADGNALGPEVVACAAACRAASSTPSPGRRRRA